MISLQPTVDPPQISSHLRRTLRLLVEAFSFLTRIPRVVYRTLGFHVIPAFYTKWESPKAVWSLSSRRVLAHSLIHIIPSLFSIGIIVFNGLGYFIGENLEGFQGDDEVKLGLIQLAAKVHELLIVSSIASIIFHYIRFELLFGDGLPLGLLTSGWSFSQVSYLWSAEFIGGIKSCNAGSGFKRWHRVLFLMLVVMGSILAILAGPMSAILMVPVRSDWLAGGGIGWMNGSAAHLWPSELDAEYFSDLNCTTPILQFYGSEPCPSAGFIPFHNLLSMGGWPVHSQVDFELREMRGVKMFHSRATSDLYMDPWAYTAHRAASSLQDALRNLHYQALYWLERRYPKLRPFPLQLTWAESVRMEVHTRAPAVRVNCNETTDSFADPFGRLLIKFPRLEEGLSTSWRRKPPEGLEGDTEPDTDHYFKADEFDLTDYVRPYLRKRGLISNASLPLDEAGLFADARRVVIIPKDIWNNTASSLGLLVLLDNADTDKVANFRALACSVDARWAKAKSVMKLLPEKQPQHDYAGGGSPVAATVELPGGENGLFGGIGLIPVDLPQDGTWSTIRLHESWYNAFSPLVPDNILPTRDLLAGPNPRVGQTSLEKLLDLVYVGGNFGYHSPERTKFADVLATIIVDGVARTGLHLNRNTSRITREAIFADGPLFDFSEHQARTLVRQGKARKTFSKPSAFDGYDTTMIEMTATYTGYNMFAAGKWSSWVSIALLGIHAVIVLIHTTRVFKMKGGGEAWDTIAELVVLAQNSTPPETGILANTSSGVQSLKTFGLVTWVENSQQRPEGENKGEGQLQLVFSKAPAIRDVHMKPEKDKLYN